ncbi:MAG: squalene/phytoene synthase family protein [Planktomarina sp.]
MSLQACADLVHRADPSRFRAAMAAPMIARKVLLPIYAANVEISRAPWVTKEPIIAQMRLQWWRDALEEIANGTPRRHEVVDALAQTLPANAAAALNLCIDAREWDVEPAAFADVPALLSYTSGVTFGPMLAGYIALGGAEAQKDRVENLALALGLARFFQAVLDLNATSGKDVLKGWNNAQITDAAKRGIAAYDAGKPLLKGRPLCTSALIEAAGAKRFLQAVCKSPASVKSGEVPSYPMRSAMSRTRVAFRIKPSLVSAI